LVVNRVFGLSSKDECQADLAVALPALESAKSALDTIKPNDIVIIKTMNNPPIGVRIVLAAVCVLKGIAPDRINDPNKPGQKVEFNCFMNVNFVYRTLHY